MFNLKFFQFNFLFHLVERQSLSLILVFQQSRPALLISCLEIFRHLFLTGKIETLPCRDKSSTSFDLLSSMYSHPEQWAHTNFPSMSNITNFVFNSVFITLNCRTVRTVHSMLLGNSVTLTSLPRVP